MIAMMAAAAALGHGGHAAMPAGTDVSIGYAAYSPYRVEVVSGETVTWTNESVRRHTVTARDLTFDSGPLSTGDTYQQTFPATGTYGYYCRLHAGITGEVDVHQVVLDAPRESAGANRPFPLTGRAAAGVREVTITGDDGSATKADVDEDGRFRAVVTPATTTTYTAGDSSPVTVLVLDHSISTRVRARPGGRWSVLAVVTPAAPRGRVVLQLRLPERFGWWPVARARLGSDSATTLRTRLRRHVRARVVLTLADGATPLAISRPFHLGQ